LPPAGGVAAQLTDPLVMVAHNADDGEWRTGNRAFALASGAGPDLVNAAGPCPPTLCPFRGWVDSGFGAGLISRG
jgi:hypothetical protein